MTRKMIVLMGALMLVASACATSGEAADAGSVAAPALTPTTVHAEAVSTEDGSGGTSEGIQVHGHWRLEVVDEGGESVQSVEFDNDLLPEGATTILQLMWGTRQATSHWSVNAINSGGAPEGTSPCPGQGSCRATYPPGAVVQFGEASFPVFGHFTASADGWLTYVYTSMEDSNGSSRRMTGTWLPEPVKVEANQSVYMHVEISFS